MTIATPHSTAARPRVYLAGPDVFLPDAAAVGEAKKRLCAEHGLEGVFPLDSPINHLDGLPPEQVALGVFDVCVTLMDTCDLAVANMTPFRGPSMDVGTAVEVGYLYARGKPVFGYSDAAVDYADRVTDDGLTVERFGLTDNLMAPGAVARSTGGLPVRGSSAGGPFDLTAMAAFAECLQRIRHHPRVAGS
jgi:nucleoside 2-deoxyribosyltransferase